MTGHRLNTPDDRILDFEKMNKIRKTDELNGIHALQLAKEISKLPDGCFTIAFYPYNKTKNRASGKLTIKERCKFREQLPQDRFQVDSENYFLFSDEKGDPKTCYRILIRYMGFPHDNFTLHKINWL